MHLDVLDLRGFYYRSGLGRAAQRAVRDQLRRIWPDAQDLTLVGFGFAVPLLRPYLDEARRVIALMPGQQGVMPWPAGRANVAVLCDETLWPLATDSADRIVMLHGLETSDNPARLLEECWRVLAPEGRAIFVVPNRAGLWSRRDATPFGFGRPYTAHQLETQLRAHGFVPETMRAALFQPPSNKAFWLRSGEVVERLGQRFSPRFAGGVLMMEVSKQVVARPPGRPALARSRLPMLEGLARPGGPPRPHPA